LDPTTWPFHVWELRNTRWRKKNNVPLSTEEVNEIIRQFAKTFSKFEAGETVLSATVFPPFNLHLGNPEPELATVIRDRVLTAAIISLTEATTRQGLTPIFTIEAQSLDHKRNQIDYFVERIGRGLFHDVGFHWVRRGKLVVPPTTAPKGTTMEMEIADLLAFVVARYFFRLLQKKPTEYPLESFGEVLWGAFTPTRFGTHPAVGFPWAHFYPDLQPPEHQANA
jgi:hypothetical protein